MKVTKVRKKIGSKIEGLVRKVNILKDTIEGTVEYEVPGIIGKWYAFTMDTEEDDARKIYEKKFGEKPQYVKSYPKLRLLLAGPVTEV